MSIRDLLPWQRLSIEGDSQTAPPPSDQRLQTGRTHGFSRRGFIHTAAGATGLAIGPGLASSALADDDDDDHRTGSAPKPIPGVTT